MILLRTHQPNIRDNKYINMLSIFVYSVAKRARVICNDILYSVVYYYQVSLQGGGSAFVHVGRYANGYIEAERSGRVLK